MKVTVNLIPNKKNKFVVKEAKKIVWPSPLVSEKANEFPTKIAQEVKV